MDQSKESYISAENRPAVGSDSERSADNQTVRLLSEILAELQQIRQKEDRDVNTIMNGLKQHDNDKAVKDNKDANDSYIYRTLSPPDQTMQQSIAEIIQILAQLPGNDM